MPRYFTAQQFEADSVEDVKEYPLPYDPETIVRVRSVSVSRMQQYSEAAAKGGNVAKRAQASLICDSIIDETGAPLFSSVDHLYNMIGKVRSRTLSALVKIISLHNGGEDEAKESDAEKKSDD